MAKKSTKPAKPVVTPIKETAPVPAPEAEDDELLSFQRTISDFIGSLDSLREFVTTVNQFLAAKGDEEFKEHAKGLFPWALAMAKIGAPGFEIFSPKEDLIRKTFDGTLEYEIKNDSEGKKSVEIKTSGPDGELFTAAMGKFFAAEKRKDLLYANALTSLISSVELLFSNLLRLFFEKAPHSIGSKEKAFSLEELSSFKTIDDAKSYLISARIENIMRGSFSDWVDFFKSNPKLTLPYLGKCEATLTEAFQRRHLFIHNGGVANNQYLSKVDARFSKDQKPGQKLPITLEYVTSVLEEFEAFGLLFARELWLKLHSKDESRSTFFGELIFKKLKEARWRLCESLTSEARQDRQMDEAQKVICNLNYFLSVKRQGRWAEVKVEAEALDFSAKGMRYQLGWLAVCEKEKEFFHLLPKAIKATEITYEEFSDFPIFEEMKNSITGKKFARRQKPASSNTRKTPKN